MRGAVTQEGCKTDIIYQENLSNTNTEIIRKI